MRDYEKKYREYLNTHISLVETAYNLLKPFLDKMNLSNIDKISLEKNIKVHDKSKFSKEEFSQYAKYFYGRKTEDVIKCFKEAVILHKKRNPHHPEYWKDKKEIMPTIYLIEMVCDWWSFSLMKGNPLEIIDYYNSNKEKINLKNSENKQVEYLLDKIECLSKENIDLEK